VLLNDRLYLLSKGNRLYKPSKCNLDGYFSGRTVHRRLFRPPRRNCQAGNAELRENGCVGDSREVEGAGAASSRAFHDMEIDHGGLDG
jgi:hypothetical protein